MHCSSCDKIKSPDALEAKQSRLNKKQTLYLCADCIRGKMEPRYLIVLFGRANGPAAIADYIINHRYVGDPILAREVVVKK